MTRAYYRLSVSALCALAAVAGPRLFVWEPFRLGYLVGGFAAALLAWGFLVVAIAAEDELKPHVLAILGAGAGALSWLRVSMVAVFDRIPQIMAQGVAPFDPVWVMGGLSPLVIPALAGWIAHSRQKPYWHGLLLALYRFSIPLALLTVSAKLVGLPKQYHSLFLFTGVMFVVLDGLGTGEDLPLLARRTPPVE